ncbi:hypothetical protein MKW94_013483 [Papaver nudicaule]|uniref:MADS-box domain-containing protein n=1 Tax=Papaver nudicaule TaxID=74823 RepID=A0AA41S990_PAPNU|nr:hypothetical protein [Papaver nudicaule]
MDPRNNEIKMIENPVERQRVFERLSRELVEEAAALTRETGATLDFVGFTPEGKTFNFGCSSEGAYFNRPISEEKVNRMLAANQQVIRVPMEESESESEDDDDEEEEEQEEEMTDGFWWDKLDVEKIDTIEKAQAVKAALLEVKKKVGERKQELAAGAATSGRQQ